jgi:hypothetical protein
MGAAGALALPFLWCVYQNVYLQLAFGCIKRHTVWALLQEFRRNGASLASLCILCNGFDSRWRYQGSITAPLGFRSRVAYSKYQLRTSYHRFKKFECVR